MRGIKRLAQHLDLSIGTVSRALNDKADVKAETRARVLAAADELGYVANQSGRSLRQGTTNAVGFVIELNAETASNGDNFFMSVFEGVTETLTLRGLDLVVLPCTTENDPAGFLRRIVGRKLVDGVILSATQRFDERIEYLNRHAVPFVALGRSETEGNYPWIDLDFEGYANRSIDRLVAAGHSRIGLAMPISDINLGTVLLTQYKAALARHGLPFHARNVFRVGSNEAGGYGLVGEIMAMQEPPTAVILSYELMAVGMYNRLHELDLLPGRDLAIIGLRESPQLQWLRPKLTCFRTPLVELGSKLGETLLAIMPEFSSAVPAEPLRMLWPLELIPGDSDVGTLGVTPR